MQGISLIRYAICAGFCLFLSSCGGGGSTPLTWPPEEPRQPGRLILVAPDETDPFAWWRRNLYEVLPETVYVSTEQQALADRVMLETNAVRTEHGLEPVTCTPFLNRVAQAHARDQAIRDYWSHNTPEGLSSRGRIAAAGGGIVATGGENSTIGSAKQLTPEAVVRSWETHVGHRDLLLDPTVRFLGVGIYNYRPDEFVYYTQLLVSFETI